MILPKVPCHPHNLHQFVRQQPLPMSHAFPPPFYLFIVQERVTILTFQTVQQILPTHFFHRQCSAGRSWSNVILCRGMILHAFSAPTVPPVQNTAQTE
jgi:hypothetical protein